MTDEAVYLGLFMARPITVLRKLRTLLLGVRARWRIQTDVDDRVSAVLAGIVDIYRACCVWWAEQRAVDAIRVLRNVEIVAIVGRLCT